MKESKNIKVNFNRSRIGDPIEIDKKLDKIKTVKFTSGIDEKLKDLKVKLSF